MLYSCFSCNSACYRILGKACERIIKYFVTWGYHKNILRNFMHSMKPLWENGGVHGIIGYAAFTCIASSGRWLFGKCVSVNGNQDGMLWWWRKTQQLSGTCWQTLLLWSNAMLRSVFDEPCSWFLLPVTLHYSFCCKHISCAATCMFYLTQITPSQCGPSQVLVKEYTVKGLMIYSRYVCHRIHIIIIYHAH